MTMAKDGNAKKPKHKYDYKLKKVDDRASFIEDKLSFIFDLPAHALMGYSEKNRNDERKYNNIPKMIDSYATYLLESKDCGSSRKMEYSYYVSERDEMRRKGNQALYRNSDCFDEFSNPDSLSLSHSETYTDENSTHFMSKDYGFESIDTQVLKYAISKNKLTKKDYKEILSASGRILIESKDEELKEVIEQIIFNCVIHSKDEISRNIVLEYINGGTLREVGEKVNVSFKTVGNRLDGVLEWVITQ